MKICIDPGHGGSDPGAVGKTPFVLKEKDFNLALSLLLRDALEAEHEVIMTRYVDRALSLSGRAKFANRYAADLFISIHANAAAVTSAEGMEVFHFPGSQRGNQLAGTVLREMLHAFPDHRDRGVKAANFTVLRLTQMPAILVEAEFLSNPDQLEFLADAANQKRMASAIARGVPAVL